MKSPIIKKDERIEAGLKIKNWEIIEDSPANKARYQVNVPGSTSVLTLVDIIKYIIR